MKRSETDKTLNYLLFGRTQTCKSSFIRDISGGNLNIKVGSGNRGISVTKTPCLYECPTQSLFPGYKLNLIDCMGWGDHKEDLEDDEIMDQLQDYLLANTRLNRINGIILTESLRSDSITCINSLTRLSQVFGSAILESSVILATKPNTLDKDELKERLACLSEIVQGKGVKGGVLPFLTSYERLPLSCIDTTSQLLELAQILNTLQILPLTIIEEKRQKIDNRAKEIEKKETKIKTIHTERDVVIMEKKSIQKSRPVIKEETVKGKRKILGIKIGSKYSTIQYIAYENYTETIEEPRVIKEPKTDEIEIIPEYQYCWRKAFEEYKANTKQEIKQKLFSKILELGRIQDEIN